MKPEEADPEGVSSKYREHRLAILVEQLGLRAAFAPQLAIQVLTTVVGKLAIELLEVVEFWNGHHEVAPSETDETFRVALLVRTPHKAEVVVVEIVRLQSQEFPCRSLAASADDLRHGNFRVVVANPLRHAAEELERPDVACLKRLSAFAGKRLAEECVAVWQRHHTEHDFDFASAIDGLRLAEIELRFARWVRQRHEDFRSLLPVTPDLVTNDGDPAGVLVFVTEPLEDPLARVALLPVSLLVGFQDRMNDRNEPTYHRLVPLAFIAMLGRFLMPEDLLDRPEVEIVLLDRLAGQPRMSDTSSGGGRLLCIGV